MEFLLDTNLLSELRKGPRADANVLRWHGEHAQDSFFTSVIVLGEIRHGIAAIESRDAAQAAALERWLRKLLLDYAGRVFEVDHRIADRWGRLCPGRTLPDADGLIAATALEHGLVVATRNTRDFERCGVPVVNPFGVPEDHG